MSTPKNNVRLFNFGRRNRLALTRVVVQDAHDNSLWQVRWWLNGYVLGRYVSLNIPWATCLIPGEPDND